MLLPPLSVLLPPAWAHAQQRSFLSSDIFPKLHHQGLLALLSLESRGHPGTHSPSTQALIPPPAHPPTPGFQRTGD